MGAETKSKPAASPLWKLLKRYEGVVVDIKNHATDEERIKNKGIQCIQIQHPNGELTWETMSNAHFEERGIEFRSRVEVYNIHGVFVKRQPH